MQKNRRLSDKSNTAKIGKETRLRSITSPSFTPTRAPPGLYYGRCSFRLVVVSTQLITVCWSALLHNVLYDLVADRHNNLASQTFRRPRWSVGLQSLQNSFYKNYKLFANLGRKISSASCDDREGAFLFQRVSVQVQRYNAVLLHDTLPATDCTDWWSAPIFVLS